MPVILRVKLDNKYIFNKTGTPGGLARGGIVEPNKTTPYNDYLGHVFWDMDTWIMPAVLMFQTHMARLMIQSRIRVLDTAADNAAGSGYGGVRFPWEQAFTGSIFFIESSYNLIHFYD
jgi:hypothetical protein